MIPKKETKKERRKKQESGRKKEEEINIILVINMQLDFVMIAKKNKRNRKKYKLRKKTIGKTNINCEKEKKIINCERK